MLFLPTLRNSGRACGLTGPRTPVPRLPPLATVRQVCLSFVITMNWVNYLMAIMIKYWLYSLNSKVDIIFKCCYYFNYLKHIFNYLIKRLLRKMLSNVWNVWSFGAWAVVFTSVNSTNRASADRAFLYVTTI